MFGSDQNTLVFGGEQKFVIGDYLPPRELLCPDQPRELMNYVTQ